MTDITHRANSAHHWNVVCVQWKMVVKSPLFINSLSDLSFVKISLTNLHSKTAQARELTFWDKVHVPNLSHVMCTMSHATCHMAWVESHISCHVIYRPGIAGAVLQSPPSLTDSFIDSLIHSSFSQSQTGRARDLTFLEKVHTTLCVMCHVSRVMCHLSPVIYHMSKKNSVFS